jgi:plasmid stabilization system protein ParE
MLAIEYLPSARRDFDESFDWYAARSTQAAIHFAEAVDAALSAVATDPERFFAVDESASGVLPPPISFSHRLSGRRESSSCGGHCPRETSSRLLERSTLTRYDRRLVSRKAVFSVKAIR